MICAACKREVEWDSLALVERFGHEELRDLLTEWPWPGGSHLEVRGCPCGATVTRVVRPSATGASEPVRV